MAGTPSPALIGVEQIVIACELAPGFSAVEQRHICQQLAEKAQLATALPVSVASPADLDPLSGKLLKDQLLLRVSGRAKDVADGRKSLALEITPVRLTLSIGALAPAQSSATLVRVQGSWILQGPVEAFHRLLAGTPRRPPHRPAVLD